MRHAGQFGHGVAEAGGVRGGGRGRGVVGTATYRRRGLVSLLTLVLWVMLRLILVLILLVEFLLVMGVRMLRATAVLGSVKYTSRDESLELAEVIL